MTKQIQSFCNVPLLKKVLLLLLEDLQYEGADDDDDDDDGGVIWKKKTLFPHCFTLSCELEAVWLIRCLWIKQSRLSQLIDQTTRPPWASHVVKPQRDLLLTRITASVTTVNLHRSFNQLGREGWPNVHLFHRSLSYKTSKTFKLVSVLLHRRDFNRGEVYT